MFTTVCCFVVGLGLGLGLGIDLVFGWYVFMHMYFATFDCNFHGPLIYSTGKFEAIIKRDRFAENVLRFPPPPSLFEFSRFLPNRHFLARNI